jgi:hypothetical protein
VAGKAVVAAVHGGHGQVDPHRSLAGSEPLATAGVPAKKNTGAAGDRANVRSGLAVQVRPPGVAATGGGSSGAAFPPVVCRGRK